MQICRAALECRVYLVISTNILKLSSFRMGGPDMQHNDLSVFRRICKGLLLAETLAAGTRSRF
jgi:hypothetical protein